MRPFRVPLASDLTPQEAIGWLRGDERPFALIGEWFGGLTVLGSGPARVAGPDEDPFAIVEWPADLRAGPPPADPPDSAAPPLPPDLAGGGPVVGGGWVGWLGYGLGARIERLPPAPPAPVPRPGFSLAFYDHVVLHDGERWWFEGLWSADRDAVLRERVETWRERLRRPPAPHDPVAAPTSFALASNGAAGHLRAVEDCRRKIAAGELYEANLCVRLEARFEGEGLDLFARALGRAQPRFGALVDGVVSLSPERFLRREGRRVWTEPIKGTRPRAGGEDERRAAREELARSAKDAAEHVMIVDLMRNDLGRVCAYGTVVAEPPRVEPHAGVWHLVSTVCGRLRDRVGDGELLRATFPPGSVTGAPKVQAMKVIAELEATRREVYTGAIGIVSPLAGLDLSVAIRVFELERGVIWLGVGGAIVADSEPERELAEAFTKATGPLAAIGGRLAQPPAGPDRRPRARRLPERALSHGARPDPALGVFETVLVEDGRAVGLDRHLARLSRSVRELYGAALPATIDAGVTAAASESVGRARLRVLAEPDGAIRISVSGAAAPSPAPAVLVAFALPGGLGAHKWRDRRLVEALARLRPGAVPLLVDTDGLVLEAAHANVWIAEGEELITPPADGRILPGTTRAVLLEADGHAREDPIDLSRLAGADSVFLTSSISGRHPAQLEPRRGAARTVLKAGRG